MLFLHVSFFLFFFFFSQQFGRVLSLLVTCSNLNEVMKVHVAFSLNVTGSFAHDFYRVVNSVAKNVLEIIRHRINMNEKSFSLFIAEKLSFA